MNLDDSKAASRKLAFAARKLAKTMALDVAACRRLGAFLNSLDGFDCVAAYMPIRTEINPLPVMQELAANGKTLCVPVIQGNGKPLLFSRWSPGGAMIDGPFGATIPKTAEYLEPDVLITPLVAFDRSGHRLGYGGGYYDRTLEQLRARKPITAVGFAYSAQELPEIPVEPTDQQLDAIVTEKAVLTFSAHLSCP